MEISLLLRVGNDVMLVFFIYWWLEWVAYYEVSGWADIPLLFGIISLLWGENVSTSEVWEVIWDNMKWCICVTDIMIHVSYKCFMCTVNDEMMSRVFVSDSAFSLEWMNECFVLQWVCVFLPCIFTYHKGTFEVSFEWWHYSTQ